MQPQKIKFVLFLSAVSKCIFLDVKMIAQLQLYIQLSLYQVFQSILIERYRVSSGQNERVDNEATGTCISSGPNKLVKYKEKKISFI